MIETNGINTIAEDERGGTPRDLFWPWCAANISVLGVGYGAFLLGFGVSFWQATVAGISGLVISFVLVGLVSIAGARGSAPTMVLSRAAFGVHGNAVPGAFSYLVLVGWETVLCALATLATATVFDRLGWTHGNGTKIVAFLVVAAIIVAAGVLGFETIMRLQRAITVATVVLTIGFVAFTIDKISWEAVSAKPSGSTQAFIGALTFAMTGFGLGWVNSAADYSRYLPRGASPRGIVGWSTLGSSAPSAILVLYGLLVCASDARTNDAVLADPIGALAGLLPTWYLVPFIVVVVLGLVGGAVLDIYSSGLVLLTLGLRLPRAVAAGIDGVLMIAGTIYVVWVASSFFVPFQGFLITLGVPIACWCGIFLADLLLRKRPYADAELYRVDGRYGAVNVSAVGTMAVGCVMGWGLVTNGMGELLTWQGYLLEPFGLGGKSGAWAYANLGVLAGIAIGFLGTLALNLRRVQRQEALAA